MTTKCSGSSDRIPVTPAQITRKNPGDAAKVASVRCPICARTFVARVNQAEHLASIPTHKA